MDEARRQYNQRLADAGDDNRFRTNDGVCVHPRRHSSDVVRLIFSQVIHDASKPDEFQGEIDGVVVNGASGDPQYFNKMVGAVLQSVMPPSPTIGDIPGGIVNNLNFAGGAGFYYSMQRDDGEAVNFRQHYQQLRAMKAAMTPTQLKFDLLFKGVWNLQVLRHTFRIETTTQTARVNEVVFLPLNNMAGIELSWTLGQLIFNVGGGVTVPALRVT
jgi:hypothetical protein